MGHREGNNRAEPLRLDLEQVIETDNPIRVTDAYMDSLDLDSFGFSHVNPAETKKTKERKKINFSN